MGIVVASGTATSVLANVKSADQVSGTYQFLPFNANVRVVCRGSATGMLVSLLANGTALVNDQAIPFTGTAGALSIQDHTMASFPVQMGSRIEFYLRNGSGGTLTTDYLILADPL